MDAKSILMSKTVWVNVLALAGTVCGILPAQYAAPSLAVVNTGLRLISGQRVSFKLPTRK